MRPIRDTTDLRELHLAGDGLVHNPAGQILHAAHCPHVGRMGPKGKLFFDSLTEASAYLSDDPRRQWSRCPECLREEGLAEAAQRVIAEPTLPVPPTAELTAIPDGFEIVADRSVPFEPRTDGQRAVRAQIRSGLRGFAAVDGQVLHARLAGTLAPGSDIENVLLYNIDQSGACMAGATRHGVRFELDREPMAHGVRYRYGLAPSTNGFESWQVGRQLAEFGRCALGSKPPRCSPTWWALKAGVPDVSTDRLRPPERFAVMLEVEGPSNALRPEALKALIDATVCSLQAHGDALTVDEPARRLGVALAVDPQVITDALRDERHAVLGTRPRLVQPWGKTVQWLPDDHLCVAGDVRFEVADEWRIGGRVCVVE